MQTTFKELFGAEAQYHIFSPYRVCPMGAHVDHQHGLVTGFAFDKGVDLLFNVTEDGSVSLRSLTFEGDIDFEITRPTQVKDGNWGDYARGAKYALKKRFQLRKGIQGLIKGSLPIGGLSSSAAVLIAYVMAFAKANDIQLTPFEVVKIASEAEREYIGLNNGLLDQACIALSEKDALLFLDTDSEQYRIIRRNPRMPDFDLTIIFSGLTRSLVNSDYNLRVAECKTAAWNMMAYTGMPLKNLDKTFLRDIPRETYDLTKEKMPPRFARRAEHFYSEYKRVRKGVTAWETGNLDLFGKLCFESCERTYCHLQYHASDRRYLWRTFLRCGLQGSMHRFDRSGQTRGNSSAHHGRIFAYVPRIYRNFRNSFLQDRQRRSLRVNVLLNEFV